MRVAKSLILFIITVFSFWETRAELTLKVGNLLPAWANGYADLSVKLDWEGIDPYYGSALLYKIEGSTFYYVTNAHVIPQNRSLWNKIFAINQFNPNLKNPIKVLAVAPGYDLALIATEWRESASLNYPQIETWLKKIYDEEPVESGLWQLNLLGVPNYNLYSTTFLKNLTWEEEAKAISLLEVDPTPIQPFQLSKEVTFLKESHICPPAFLETCFQIPIRTWGFSGGVLLVKKLEDAKAKLAGIISHYSPLSEWTYVIPWKAALPVVKLMKEGYEREKKFFVLKTDLKNHFELSNFTTMKVIDKNSPLFNTTIQTTNQSLGFAKVGGGDFSGGGGDFSGGGGDFSGGGGDFSGGGGDFSGGGGSTPQTNPKYQFYFFEDRWNNLAGFANFNDMVSEITHMDQWGTSKSALGKIISMSANFKGLSSLFSFYPGLQFNKASKIRFGKKPLLNLQDFVSAYEENPKSTLEDTIHRRPLPEFLESAKNRPGLETSGFIQKLKSAREIENVFKTHPLKDTNYPLITTLETVLQVKQQDYGGKINNKDIDVVLVRNRAPSSSSLLRASAWREKDKFYVQFLAGKYGIVKVSFLDQWSQEADNYYKYVGLANFSTNQVMVDQPGNELVAACVAGMFWDEDRKVYELKIVLVANVINDLSRIEKEKLPVISDVSEPFFDPNRIFVQAIYLPLQMTDAKKPVVATESETRIFTERNKVYQNRTAKFKNDGAHPEVAFYEQHMGKLTNLAALEANPDKDYKRMQAEAVKDYNDAFDAIDAKLNPPTEEKLIAWKKIVEIDKMLQSQEERFGLYERPAIKLYMVETVKRIEYRTARLSRMVEKTTTLKNQLPKELSNEQYSIEIHKIFEKVGKEEKEAEAKAMGGSSKK